VSVTHTSCERSLVLGPMADETRRSLGPLSWAALEALVTDAHPSEDGGVVNTSVRQLAARLGVAKNTAHRALVTLRDAGFLEPHQSRSTSGQFAAGAYRLSVAPSILRPVADSSLRLARRRPSKPGSSSSAVPLPPALPAVVGLRPLAMSCLAPPVAVGKFRQVPKRDRVAKCCA
jgi:hypothetical protein